MPISLNTQRRNDPKCLVDQLQSATFAGSEGSVPHKLFPRD